MVTFPQKLPCASGAADSAAAAAAASAIGAGVCGRDGCSLASAHAGAHFASHWRAEGDGLRAAVADSPSFFTVAWPSAEADGDAGVDARLLRGALDEAGEADGRWERRLRVRFDPAEACPEGAHVSAASGGVEGLRTGFLTRCEVGRARAGHTRRACARRVCVRAHASVRERAHGFV